MVVFCQTCESIGKVWVPCCLCAHYPCGCKPIAVCCDACGGTGYLTDEPDQRVDRFIDIPEVRGEFRQ